MSHNRRNALSIESLEDRTTPATASFVAGTLTIVPVDGELIRVALKASMPFNSTPGFLEVTNGVDTFFSSTASQNVKSIIVNGSKAANYNFDLSSGVDLTSLIVRGATTTTNVYLDSNRLSSGFTFYGTGSGNDTFYISAYNGQTSTTLYLGAGNNEVNFYSGIVGANLTINSLGGDDGVFFANNGPFIVGGNVNIQLGEGTNAVVGTAMQTMTIGKNLTYIGGNGFDKFDFATNDTSLRVGGNITFLPKSCPTNAFNSFHFNTVNVGGNITYLGGASNDSLMIQSSSNVGGNVIFTGLAGANRLNLLFANIGGSIVQSGTTGSDILLLRGIRVNQNVVATLGNDDMSGNTVFGPGIIQSAAFETSAIQNIVGGNVIINGGANADPVRIENTKIGRNLTINTYGDNDVINLDDLLVLGSTSMNLGDGADSISIDFAVGLPKNCSFIGAFTIYGGNGNDYIDLSSNGGQNIQFGGLVKIFGDSGNDILINSAMNTFIQPASTRIETCEFGDF
jgi:hypothetical protein